MKRILKEWLKNPKSSLLLVMYMILSIGYSILSVTLITLIAKCFDERSTQSLIEVLIVAIATVIATPLYRYCINAAKLKNFTSIANRWYSKLIEADYRMFAKYSCADIYSTGSFLWNINAMMISTANLILDIIEIIIQISAIWIIAPTIVIPVIVIYTISILVFKIFYTKMSERAKISKDCVKKRNQQSENITYGFAEVRSFGTQEMHKEKIGIINDEIEKTKLSKTNMLVGLVASIELFEKGSMMAGVLYCLSQLADNVITASTAMAVITFIANIISPLVRILDYFDEVSENLSLADDFEKIINFDNDSNHGDVELDGFNDSIKFDNVNFSYEKSSNTLDGISFEVKKGMKVGICGVSGGGKSTIFKLLNRFYRPNKGSITIDGISIYDVDAKSFGRIFGSVHQSNTIFPGSIKDNICYGIENVMESELIDAAKKANIYDFIMSLPNKFNTDVGPRGLKLSGGQQQRIALARIFLRNPKIVLLDEATSALDNESETLIQEAIEKLDCTVIAIAHRLSTIRSFDKIVVVNSGKIVESGSHDELVALNGAYASMLK